MDRTFTTEEKQSMKNIISYLKESKSKTEDCIMVQRMQTEKAVYIKINLYDHINKTLIYLGFWSPRKYVWTEWRKGSGGYGDFPITVVSTWWVIKKLEEFIK